MSSPFHIRATSLGRGPAWTATDQACSILKYVIVGDSAVGKSSLLVRLTDDRFSEAGTEPTLGVEFGSRILDCGRGRKVKVQCKHRT